MSEEVIIRKKKKKFSSSSEKPDRRLPKATKKLTDVRGEIQQLEDEAASLDLEGNGGPEAVFKREYKKMLRYNARLIRRMNDQLEQQMSSRDIYALSTLMSQQREVIADLRTLVDMSEQVEMVQRQVLTPFVSESVQLVTDTYYQLRKLITEVSTPKQTQFALRQLEELIKQVGIGLQAGNESARDKLNQILLGDSEPKRKKK